MPDFDLPPVVTADPVEMGSKSWTIIQWCKDRLDVGQKFVEASPGYEKISRNLDSIFSYESKSGASYAPTQPALSSTRTNRVAKTAEDLVSQLTDTRVFWSYSTNNPKYAKQSRLGNVSADSWYRDNLISLRIADVIRYYTIGGTGYAHMTYSRLLDDQILEAEDPRNVFPIEPTSYHSIQDSLGVIIRKARTVSWVYNEYGIRVKPDIGGAGVYGWFLKTYDALKSRTGGPLTKREADAIPAVPTYFVNTMYLNDRRVNEGKSDVYMGHWGTDDTGKAVPKNQWSYIVKPNQPLYPFKRLIVWGTDHLLYDGPSPFWHGMFPIIKLTLNPWPKHWLGKSPLTDIVPLNDSMNNILRVIDDHAAQVANPGIIGDRNVSRNEMNKFDSRTPGWKLKTNLASGKGITVVNPPALDASLWPHVDWLKREIQELSGTADMAQVAQLGQLPAADTIDTLMKAMTPGNRNRSRILEGFMTEIAKQYFMNMCQFDTLAKRLEKFGPDSVTPEDYDYEPGSMIPDDFPSGEPGDIASNLNALLDGPRPLYKRAQLMAKSIAMDFAPGSLLNSSAIQDILQDLMLAKMGYLSFFTLMERMGKKNVIPPGLKVPDDEIGRLQLQQQLGIGMIANAQGRKATDQAQPGIQSGGNGPTLTTS